MRTEWKMYMRLHRSLNLGAIHSSIVVPCPLSNLSQAMSSEGLDFLGQYIEKKHKSFGPTSFEVFSARNIDLAELDVKIRS